MKSSVPSSHDDPRDYDGDDGTVTMMSSMTIKDRTKEFTAAAERAAKTLAAASGTSGESPSTSLLPHNAINPPSSTSSHSEFAKMSSRIGHGIHGTSQKLERLAQLAKRSSMFDDPAQEIAELSAVIKQDITVRTMGMGGEGCVGGGSKKRHTSSLGMFDSRCSI